MLSHSGRETLRFPVFGSREAFENQETRGEWEEGNDPPIDRVKRKPGEPENSGEQEVPARIKTSGAQRGTAIRVGNKPLERRCEAQVVS